VSADEPDPVRASLERALGGGYRILRLLGRGGMGAVYLARELSLERLVAIKALSQERGLDAASRERFRREARTAARLMHSNIVPLHAFGEADGMMYLVMGYVSGESLADRLRREGRLGVNDARRVLAEMADALDHAHRQGVVHRDVKPDNVLIEDETGRALLTDFGIAKALGAAGGTMTQAGAVVGTPHYMSPEQAAGKEQLDGRADLYSLGAVGYALLAGRPPFEGSDVRDLLVKHMTQAPAELHSLRPDIPDDLAAAVARCLVKDPAARWPDARAFREAVAPTGLGGDELPEPLDALDGRAPMLLLLVILFANALSYSWLSGFHRAGFLPGALLVCFGGLLVYQLPSLVSAARFGLGRGFSRRQVIGAFLRQPTWWYALWYPRRWRRPGDVWDRLPFPFRFWRTTLTLLLAIGLPFATYCMLVVADPEIVHSDRFADRAVSTLVMPWLAALVGLLLANLVSLGLCARHVLSLGFDVYKRRRVTSALLSQPTMLRSIWKRPEYAGLLLPAPVAASARTEPRLPREYASWFEREAAAATGAARVALERAAADARALAAERDALDPEIARLAKDADTSELERLRWRVEQLGPQSEAEGEERRRLRRLLAEQVDLLENVAERLREARARKEEKARALRDLWRRAERRSGDEVTATRAR
jgi:hypothetical protein